MTPCLAACCMARSASPLTKGTFSWCVDSSYGLRLGDAELPCKLALAHAVHDSEVHDLSFLAADASEVRHHLVQVDVAFVVRLHHAVDHVVTVLVL
jgi:hypothetical protein